MSLAKKIIIKSGNAQVALSEVTKLSVKAGIKNVVVSQGQGAAGDVNVYVNGVLKQTSHSDDLRNETINITID